MEEMMTNFLEEAKGLQDELVKIRRRLHQNPEIGMDLPLTVALVKDTLRSYGVEPVDCGQSGVTAIIGGKKPGKCFLIRGDMDALPMKEEVDSPFKSSNDWMHSCGHDFHTAMLLGAAKLLKAHEGEIPGTVKLMFQPGEEVLGGAKAMIAAGVLENPKVDAGMMIHVIAGLPMPTGTVAVPGLGPFAAASDHFECTIYGKGGHGATPDHCVDPVLVASHLIIALQAVVSREVPPDATAVLTVAVVKAGGDANNIIPDTAYMKGTIRTYDPKVRAFIQKRVPEICTAVAAVYRATAEGRTIEGCPPVVVDAAVSETVRETLTGLFGKAVIPHAIIPKLSGSEDFAFVTEKIPGLMMAISAGSPAEGNQYGQHNPKVVFNEAVLSQGAVAYAAGAVGWLGKNN